MELQKTEIYKSYSYCLFQLSSLINIFFFLTTPISKEEDRYNDCFQKGAFVSSNSYLSEVKQKTNNN